MLDKLEKLESMVNGLLGKIFGWIKSFIISLIPKKIKSLFSKTVVESKEKINHKKEKVATQTKELAAKVGDKKALAQQKISVAREFPVKETAILKFAVFKQFIQTTPLNFYTTKLKSFLSKLTAGIKSKLSLLSPKQTILAVLFIALTSLGGVAIYSSSVEIYENEFPNRVPASVQEYEYRPKYRNYQKTTMKVFNIRLPLFVENVREIRSVTVDFSVRTSTRFASKYLTAYEYKLKDYFFTKTEPFASDFPLKEEGKEVLRDKIKDELNNFLQEHRVEGVVQEVNIIFIIAS